MGRILPVCSVIGVTWLLAWPAIRWASAEPAHFWISTSPIDSTGPVALTVNRAQGSIGTLYIWAEPETADVGATCCGNPYNAVSNVYKELQNLSLNLVTDVPGIDFLDNGISVYNPSLTNPYTQRFQFDYDSVPTGFPVQNPPLLPLASTVNGGGAADKIIGLQAFSFGSNVTPGYTQYAGIGPTCVANNLCAPTIPNGPPAWLLASVAYKTLQNVGNDVKINLQIGGDGINHALNTGVTETSSKTWVRFGTSSAINASTNRGISGAQADLTVHACAATAGDYNGDCKANAADYTVWRDTRGSTTDLRADGNGSGGIDSGDYTFWTLHFVQGPGAGSGSLDGGSVPEPTTLMLLITAALAIGLRRATV